MTDTTNETNTNPNPDRFRLVAGIILLGSVWGMLECTLGGYSPVLAGVQISMGAILAGVFALGFLALGRRLFPLRGVAIGMAVIAGLLRFIAPIGTFVYCSAIAIMAEGVVFEIIMSRKQFSLKAKTMRDPRSLAYLGVIMGYAIFVVGYITTQILTPVVSSGSGSVLDVVDALPIILGRGFFAALLGGVSLPLVVLAPQLSINVARVKKEFYYTASALGSAFSWAVIVYFYYPWVL